MRAPVHTYTCIYIYIYGVISPRKEKNTLQRERERRDHVDELTVCELFVHHHCVFDGFSSLCESQRTDGAFMYICRVIRVNTGLL